jgi:FlaA1/EpsC-like NDP-sugar epimerase
VLVTGAGGSIGGQLAEQLYVMGGSDVFLLDHDESALHGLQLRLAGSGLLDNDHLILGDIRDRESMRELFGRLRPNLVFHAAALKHLPLLERFPCEGVKTNVMGTQNLVDAAVETGVERFILISTDKAAAPTSVLGYTKRLAELLVAESAGLGGTGFASVRFGNVLGTRGSLLETLRWQIERGLPVTLTHPYATRFFMSIPEAVGLVLQAATLATAGETYVLDMGSPVRIAELVQRFAEVAGAPHIRVVYRGLRPGEKLHEVLTDAAEVPSPTAFARIGVVPAGRADPQLRAYLAPVFAAARNADSARVRRGLAALPCLRSTIVGESTAIT